MQKNQEAKVKPRACAYGIIARIPRWAGKSDRICQRYAYCTDAFEFLSLLFSPFFGFITQRARSRSRILIGSRRCRVEVRTSASEACYCLLPFRVSETTWTPQCFDSATCALNCFEPRRPDAATLLTPEEQLTKYYYVVLTLRYALSWK